MCSDFRPQPCPLSLCVILCSHSHLDSAPSLACVGLFAFVVLLVVSRGALLYFKRYFKSRPVYRTLFFTAKDTNCRPLAYLGNSSVQKWNRAASHLDCGWQSAHESLSTVSGIACLIVALASRLCPVCSLLHMSTACLCPLADQWPEFRSVDHQL